MSAGPIETDWRGQRIAESEIYVWVAAVLERGAPGKYVTLGDLDRAPAHELLAIPRFGRKAYAHVQQALRNAREA